MVNKSRNSVIGRLTVQHYLEYYIYHIGMTVRLKVRRPIINQGAVGNVNLSGRSKDGGKMVSHSYLCQLWTKCHTVTRQVEWAFLRELQGVSHQNDN